MARKSKNKKAKTRNGGERSRPKEKEFTREPWHTDVHPEIKKIVGAILFFVLAMIFTLSFIGKGGNAGNFIYRVFSFLLGSGYFFAPLTFLFIGVSLFFAGERRVVGITLFGGALFLFSNLAALHILIGPGRGGFLGSLIGKPILQLFDFWAGLIIVISVLVISVLLVLNVPFWQRKEEDGDAEGEEDQKESALTESGLLKHINNAVKSVLEKKEESDFSAHTFQTDTSPSQSASVSSPLKDEGSIALRKITRKFDYKKPPLELLQGDRGTPSSGDIRANANIIKRTLENFGIYVEMDEVSIGPTVTQYTLKPAEGVKLSRIVALHNDLSLALAAHPIRIEAPIPGKSLVGIEVPNRSIALVGLRALLEQRAFQESAHPLYFVLGRDVAGFPVFADLAKMPHLLISGATGTGKSVTVHTMITSLLYRNPPEILRFIIVDPKRVELSVYNDIPHLLTPVITDPKTTVQALRWATREMDRRYDLLSVHGARDIVGFNAEIAKSGAGAQHGEGESPEILPYIMIIIDELADLMATFPREVESSIIRLAQMARAVGIHLIVATQRPSVEVITGLIKANITSRIALQVASQIDSRTILDMAGAEKLLGNGDMLFLAGDTARPRRIQGAFVSEQEVKRVVAFLRETDAPEYNEGILETKLEEDFRNIDTEEGDDDPLYADARGIVIQTEKASASYLQRRLRIGYARAARLLDLLEANGVIGPGEGAKPREVLIKTAQMTSSDVLEE